MPNAWGKKQGECDIRREEIVGVATLSVSFPLASLNFVSHFEMVSSLKVWRAA